MVQRIIVALLFLTLFAFVIPHRSLSYGDLTLMDKPFVDCKGVEYKVFTVRGQTAWDIYKSSYRRDISGKGLPHATCESNNRLMIVDAANHYIFLLELEL